MKVLDTLAEIKQKYILGQKGNAAAGYFILILYFFKKRIKIRKLETELIENFIFAIF